MTPEQEAQDRLRRAIVDDEFPDAEQVEASPFSAVIPDPLAFERNAAISAWMSQASGRNVDAGTPTWQAEKDSLAQGFFKMPTAKGITDSEIHGLVRQHVMTSEEAVMDGINAALAGRPLLEAVSAFDTKAGASKLRAKWPEYSQEMRKYYDATEARVAPYRDLIKSSAAQLGSEMESGLPTTDAFKAVADQLLEIPEADRRIVIKAMAATGGDTPDAQRSYLGKLGAAFGRMSEGLGSSVESGVSDLIYSMAASGGIEDVNPEAASALRQQGQTTRSYYQLANMVRKVADSDISPIEAEGFLAETGIGLARMGPLLASSAVPYAGVATMASFYRDDVAANLMLEYEGLDAAKADKIALVAAPGIAALEHASNLLPFGKLPGVGSFLKSSITSIKAGIIRGGTLVTMGTGGEIAEEVFQEIAPKLVQDLFAEVDKEVPGVNWTDEKKKLEKIPAQVFGPALAVSLIGGGVVSVNDVKHGRAISSDRDNLIASNYAPSLADEIVAKSKEGDWPAVDTLMRSAYDRKKGGISGATEQERKAAVEAIQAKVLLQQSAIESLRNNGDLARAAKIGGQWVVTRPDGSAPVAFDNPDDANGLVFQDAKERNLRVQAVYRDIISQANRDLQEGQELAFVFSPEKMDAKYAVQIGLVSAEAVEGRKKQLAALDEGKLEDQDFTRAEKEAQAEGDTDAVYTILGMNNIENREGVSRGVIRLFQGANFTDLIEEISEVSLKRHLISGEAKRPSMLASLRQAETAIQAAEQVAGLEPTLLFRTKDDAQISDGDLIEAFSHLAKSYYINAIEDGKTSQNWRLKNRNVTRHLRALRSALANTEIFKWLKAMGEKLGTIYKRAAMVQEVQKAGGLDAGLEQLIRRSVGLDTQDQMEAGILQEAQGIVEEAGMSLSKVYRAGDTTETGIKPFASYTEDIDTAKAYLDNPGFGGPTLREINIPDDLNVFNMGEPSPSNFKKLAVALGFDADVGQDWFDNGWQYPWEESSKVKNALADSEFDAVRYTDDFPAGAKTIIFTRNPIKEDAVTLSLSKGDQSLEQRLAAMFDPFQKNPEQRRKLGLIAKERVAKVAAEYADVVAMAGATREKLAALDTKYSEELAASRADYQAEMKALRDERDFELEGAKQQKETKVNIEKIKADYAARIAARDKVWEREKGDLELRQSNERGAIQRGLGKLDTESLRQAIRTLGAAISIMPSKVVAKILPGGVNELFRIKTDAGRLEAIERLVVKADAELEKFLREEITATINKKLDRYESAKDSSGRMKGKIESTATEAIDYAVAFKALPKSSEADEVDANTQDGQVEFLEASLAKSESTAEQIQDALNKLGIANLFHDFNNLDAESLARINDWLDETIAKGRAIRRALDEERKSYLQTQKKAALSEVTKGDETSQIEAQNKESEVSSSWFQSMMDRIKGAVYAMLPTTAQQLEQIFGVESATMRHFSDRIWAAANKATDIKRDIEAKRKQAMEAIFPGMGELRQVAAITKLQKARASGVTLNVGRVTEDVTIPIATLEKLADKTITAKSMGLNDSQVEEALKQWADSKRKESATIKKVLNAGREVPLTMSELDGVQYLLSWNQPDVRTRMERNGWSQESIKQLNAFISPEARALGMWMSATYEQGAEMIDPIYRRLFNAPLPRVKNYAPTYYDISGADALLPVDQQQNASGLASGFTKARRQHNENLKRVDALTAFLSHWEHVSHWVAFVEVVRDMRAVLTDKQVQAAIRQKIGAAQASSLVKRIKAIETQGNNQAWSLHELDSFFKNLNTARAFKGLAFRLSPVVKQTSALLNPLLADVPVHEYMRGLAKFAAGQLEVKAMWDSDTIRRRVEGGFSPEARLAMSAKGRTVIGAQALTLMQKGMMPMQWTDAGWTSLGAAISFDFYRRQALKAGATEAMADAEAAKRLERMIATSAQPTDLVNRALIEGSPSPFTKSVWMFASESRKTLAIEVYALQRLLTGKSKSVGLDVQRVLVAHFVMGMVTQLMSGFLSLLAGDEEDREREWSLDQWTAAIMAGPINGLFVLGDGVNYAIRRALGVRTFQTVSPTAKAMNDLSASALNISDLFGDDPDAMLKEVDRLSGSIGAAAAALIGPAGAAVDVIFGNPLREADKILSDED